MFAFVASASFLFAGLAALLLLRIAIDWVQMRRPQFDDQGVIAILAVVFIGMALWGLYGLTR